MLAETADQTTATVNSTIMVASVLAEEKTADVNATVIVY